MVVECAVAGFFVFSCTTPDPAPAAARFCNTSEPIKYSRNDTADTRRQVVKHNAKGVELCGWGKR